MIHDIDIEEFLDLENKIPLIDVRSPGEFEKGHIPGSVNIPLFTNEERAAIGTLYKKEGQDKAIVLGESFAVPKIDWYLKAVSDVSDGKNAAVYCFRGGLRSGRFSTLLAENGWKVYRLSGGYKSYRRAAKACFSQHHSLLILGGRTGSGKTDILKELERKKEAVIDLEGLASHRGSAFGNIGLEKQPTTEQFENNLYERFRLFKNRKPIWLEDESSGIGRIFLPEELFRTMRSSPMIVLNISAKIRVERLCEEYTQCGKEPLIEAVGKITRRLGGERADQAIRAIEAGNLREAASIVLDYYDKCYDYGMKKDESRIIRILDVDHGNPSLAADELLRLKDSLSLSF